MRGAERVVFALRPLGEAGQAATLAQRSDTLTAAGENLMGIGLVTDVPQQPVPWRVEYRMDSDRQFHNAQ